MFWLEEDDDDDEFKGDLFISFVLNRKFLDILQNVLIVSICNNSVFLVHKLVLLTKTKYRHKEKSGTHEL